MVRKDLLNESLLWRYTLTEIMLRSEEAQDPGKFALLDACLFGDFGDWQSVWVADKSISHFGFDNKADASGLVMDVSALNTYCISVRTCC
jgi:hypothetical protein